MEKRNTLANPEIQEWWMWTTLKKKNKMKKIKFKKRFIIKKGKEEEEIKKNPLEDIKKDPLENPRNLRVATQKMNKININHLPRRMTKRSNRKKLHKKN